MRYGTIILGERLSTDIASWHRGDTVMVLPPGSFDGSERTLVRFTGTGLVSAVTTEYGRDANYEMLVKFVTGWLGEPERTRSQLPNQEPTELAVWRDVDTEHRLLRDPNRADWLVRRDLLDRTLTQSPP